jgi:hypothetical protein
VIDGSVGAYGFIAERINYVIALVRTCTVYTVIRGYSSAKAPLLL